MGTKTRIVILGGGFGGVYTAMYLEKLAKKRDDIEIALVNRENYFVYQPMLPEVVGGSLGILDTVSSIRRLLPHTALYIREIDCIDLQKKTVCLAPQFSHKNFDLEYDHLVLALGNVTDFKGTSGLHEHALPFKNLADSLVIRNRVIEALEAAACEPDEDLKKKLLTFVVGGGGFSGTEIVAEINDFVRKMVKKYKRLDPKLIKVVLVHSKDHLMERELSESLGRYAGDILQKRGVEIRFNRRLIAATPQEAILDDGEHIPSKTIVSTVPSSPNPIIDALEIAKEKGKVKTDMTMLVENTQNIWALGDCAAIPNKQGDFCPPTAQFAIREAKVLAGNIMATLNGKERKPFTFEGIGMLGALGHQRAVAELFGKVRISGFIAWLMWRAIYWVKLPGGGRKVKVFLSWLLDFIVPIEPVQLKIAPTQGIAKLHFEPGEIIFNEGDIGDYLYIIVEGEVEVLKKENGKDRHVANLRQGEYFGEMALLSERQRSATVRCTKPTNVLAMKKADFGYLISSFEELRKDFHHKGKERKRMLG